MKTKVDELYEDTMLTCIRDETYHDDDRMKAALELGIHYHQVGEHDKVCELLKETLNILEC